MRKKAGKKRWHIGYWGYLFLLPFFLAYFIFFFYPFLQTIEYSFYEYYETGLTQVGPNFVGLSNYASLMKTDMLRFAGNTLKLWVLGFLPQFGIALLLAAFFTDLRFKIRGEQFFKVIIYLPNMVMASAMAMLFFTLFSNSGPMNALLMRFGFIKEPIAFFNSVGGTSFLICFMNVLMWFGNTTMVLIAGIVAIPTDVLESARLDGCTQREAFFKVTLPMIRPIMSYVLITSMISGIQMFDVPQVLTDGTGNPNRTSMTLIMYLNRHLLGHNYGMAGAVSVYLFLASVVLCAVAYRILDESTVDNKKSESLRKKKRQFSDRLLRLRPEFFRKREQKKRIDFLLQQDWNVRHAKKQAKKRGSFIYAVLGVLAFVCLFFFYVLLVNATKSHIELQKGFSFLPGRNLVKNFKSVANDANIPIFYGVLNSMIVAICSAACSVYVSVLTAYGLFAYRFRLRRAVVAFIMAVMVMPTQVCTLGFLQIITGMGLRDSLLALILPSMVQPTVVYFMFSYMKSVFPISLIESARIDGGSETRIFTRMVVPLMRPAMVVQGIFAFVASWNNYFIPALVISSKKRQTLPIMIATVRGSDGMNMDAGKVYMMMAIAIIPMIFVYLMLSRQILEGVMNGSVKE